MKRNIWARLLIIITLVLTLTGCGKSATATLTTMPTTSNVSDITSINDVLQPLLEQYQIPAIAAVVISDGNIIAQGAVGERKFGDSTPVTIDDQWLLGSCTKAFTATLIGILVEKGKLNWTTTMGEIYPELRDRMLPKYRDVTIIELLSHHAGMISNTTDAGYPPGTTAAYWLGLTEPITQQRYEFTKDILCQPDSPAVNALPAPGTTFLYSNVGYVIAGAAAEQVTGKSWEDLVTTLIFQPLGMTTAGFGAMSTGGLVDQPWLHYISNGTIIPVPPDYPRIYGPAVDGPAGMIHISVKDWAKFVTMHLEGEKGGSSLLKPETFKILHTPPFDTGAGYALGWFYQTDPFTGGMALWHGGTNGVNYAYVWMSPKSDFAILITTNIGGNDANSACNNVIATLVQQFLPKK
jgi:CubicO group peptidase (beta-lactamase class C family)